MLALILAAALGAQPSHTFTNPTTGEVLKGTLIARAGGYLHVKTTDGQKRQLPAAEWRVIAIERPKPKPTSRPKPKPKPTVVKNPAVVYRGDPRTEAWLKATHIEFCWKIVLHKGRFIESGREVLTKAAIWSDPPEPGALRWAVAGSRFRKAKIFQALQGTEALISLSVAGMTEDILFHVKRVALAHNIDGATFRDVPLVYVGRYTYTTALGAPRTVQSYIIHRPLTLEQFKKALESGLKLVRRKKVKRKKKVRTIISGGFRPQIGWRTVTEERIVEELVP